MSHALEAEQLQLRLLQSAPRALQFVHQARFVLMMTFKYLPAYSRAAPTRAPALPWHGRRAPGLSRGGAHRGYRRLAGARRAPARPPAEWLRGRLPGQLRHTAGYQSLNHFFGKVLKLGLLNLQNMPPVPQSAGGMPRRWETWHGAQDASMASRAGHPSTVSSPHAHRPPLPISRNNSQLSRRSVRRAFFKQFSGSLHHFQICRHTQRTISSPRTVREVCVIARLRPRRPEKVSVTSPNLQKCSTCICIHLAVHITFSLSCLPISLSLYLSACRLHEPGGGARARLVRGGLREEGRRGPAQRHGYRHLFGALLARPAQVRHQPQVRATLSDSILELI